MPRSLGYGRSFLSRVTRAKHSRWTRAYTDLVYQPMLEVMAYLRANGYKTYIVTGTDPGLERLRKTRLL
jgi:phosphoserine phosphatase